jgi:hypothetical protein
MRLLVMYGRYHYRVATGPVATLGGLPAPELAFEGGHRIVVAPEVVLPEKGHTAPLLGREAVRLQWGPEVGLRLSGGVPIEITPPPTAPTPGVLVVYVGEGPYLKMRVTGPRPGSIEGSRELYSRPNRGRMATPNGVWLLPPPPPEGLDLSFRWKWEEVGLRLFPEGIVVGPRAEVDRVLAASNGEEEVL